MSDYKASVDFGVIGLGRFGFALAETLANNGKEVLVLDMNPSKIKQIQDKVQQAFVVSQLDKITLQEAGIQNCATVIVCIGEHLESSIMTTLNVIELGVPRVIAKAISFEHGRVLEKIGAVAVYPERDRAIRLANSLSRAGTMDFLGLSSEYEISEIWLNDKIHGKTIAELDLRKKFSINVIAIVRGSETIVEIHPNLTLNANDVIVVIGKKDNVTKLEHLLGNSKPV